MVRAVHVRIAGRVQGVGFRAWTRQTAEALGLRGWVRNETDGSVAALLAGEDLAVSDMLAALRRGPDASAVTGMTVNETDDTAPRGFEIRR